MVNSVLPMATALDSLAALDKSLRCIWSSLANIAGLVAMPCAVLLQLGSQEVLNISLTDSLRRYIELCKMCQKMLLSCKMLTNEWRGTRPLAIHVCTRASGQFF